MGHFRKCHRDDCLHPGDAVMLPVPDGKFRYHAPAFCGAGDRVVLPSVPWVAF